MSWYVTLFTVSQWQHPWQYLWHLSEIKRTGWAYDVNMKIIQLILIGALLGYTVGQTNNSVFKRQKCLQFEMEDHTSTAPVIYRRYYNSKLECMTSCVRHRSCNTFQFRSTDGFCELLEVSEMCMSHKVTNGTTLVRLSGCNRSSPWKVVTSDQSKLLWMEPHNVGPQRFILTTPDTRRQIARVLFNGTYVPGHVHILSGKFFASTMADKLFRCDEAFHVLTYVHPDDYLWISFASGDEVPLSAVVGGYWRDETPHYIIIEKHVLWIPGYYNGATKQIYVKKNTVRERTALHLLLENN